VKVERAKPLESVEDIDVGCVDDDDDDDDGGAGVVEKGEGEEELKKVVTMEEKVGVSEVVEKAAVVDGGVVSLSEVKDLKDGMGKTTERSAQGAHLVSEEKKLDEAKEEVDAGSVEAVVDKASVKEDVMGDDSDWNCRGRSGALSDRRIISCSLLSSALLTLLVVVY
jgi:hypothetical protein